MFYYEATLRSLWLFVNVTAHIEECKGVARVDDDGSTQIEIQCMALLPFQSV